MFYSRVCVCTLCVVRFLERVLVTLLAARVLLMLSRFDSADCAASFGGEAQVFLLGLNPAGPSGFVLVDACETQTQ